MGRIKLKEVLIFDNGVNTPDSFVIAPLHHSRQDPVRLVCDLLLATRARHGTHEPVDFTAVESLINQAAELLAARIAVLITLLGIIETGDGLVWVEWEAHDGPKRKPTVSEVTGFEGESRLMWDALPRGNENADLARRLLASWGVFCVERAIVSLRFGDAPGAIDLYASAGLLLSHSNFFDGCLTVDELSRTARISAGAKGGNAKAAATNEVRDEAIRLAKAQEPVGGWQSAPQAAEAIMVQLREFARTKGRSPSARKVAEWLRETGIKRGGSTR